MDRRFLILALVAVIAVTAGFMAVSDDSDAAVPGAPGETFEQNGLTFKVLTAPAGGSPGTLEMTSCDTAATSIPLEYWTVPDYEVTEIKMQAFNNCNSLTDVCIPGTVSMLLPQTFYNCSGAPLALTLSEGVQTLSANIFYQSVGPVSISLPSTVTQIDAQAFKGCRDLQSFTVSQDSDSFIAYGGVLFSRDLSTLLCYPASKVGTSYACDASYNLKKIADYAFSGTVNLTELIVPDNVLSIGNYAFRNSSVQSVVMSDNVTDIPEGAFENCGSLTSIDLGTGVISIGMHAFRNSALTSVVLPSSVAQIRDSAFISNTALASINLSDNIRTLETKAFNGCTSLNEVYVPACLTSSDVSVFEGCTGLTSVTISPGLGSLPDRTFANVVSFTSVSVPIGMTVGTASFSVSFYQSAEAGSPMASPAGHTFVKSGDKLIVDKVFVNIHLPAKQNPAAYAVKAGEPLPEITAARPGYVLVQPVELFTDETLSSPVAPDYTVTEPVTLYAKWKMADVGTEFELNGITYRILSNTPEDHTVELVRCSKSFVGNLSIGDADGYNVVSVADNAFKDCVKLNNVFFNFENTVTSIGNNAFQGCTSIAEVRFNDNLNSIGGGAFMGCTSLVNVYFGSSIKTLGNSVFRDCTSIKSLEIPSGITAVPIGMVQGCTNLKTLFLPSGIEEICDSAFKNSGLKDLIIEEGVTGIGNSVFYGCTSLQSLYLPSTLRSIGDYCFVNCDSMSTLTLAEDNRYMTLENGALYDKDRTKLFYRLANQPGDSYVMPSSVEEVAAGALSNSRITSVTLSPKITFIQEYMFNGCLNLKSITVQSEIGTIRQLAFANCTSLESAFIPDGVRSVGQDAFKNCTSLKHVVVPESVTGMSSSAFTGCTAITDIKINGSLTVENGTFVHAVSVLSVYIGPDVKGVGFNSFNVNAAKVSICSGVPTVHPQAFSHWFYDADGTAGNKYVDNVPAGYEFTLKEVDTGGSKEMRYVPTGACITFETSDHQKAYGMYPYGTTPVSFPTPEELDKDIRGHVIEGFCSDAECQVPLDEGYKVEAPATVYIKSTPIVDGTTFKHGLYTFQAVTESGSLMLKITEYDRNDVSTSIVIPTQVHGIDVGLIASSAFKRLQNLESITVPGTLVYLPSEFISYCPNLREIVLSEGITTTSWTIARDCPKLTAINFPTTLSILGNYAFVGCPMKTYTVSEGSPYFQAVDGVLYSADLKTLVSVPVGFTGALTVLPGADTIKTGSIYGISGLTSLTVPAAVTLESGWCGELTGLESVQVSGTGPLKVTDNVLFDGDTLVLYPVKKADVSYTVPAGTKHIGDNAFANTIVESVVLPEGLLTIGANAFTFSGITSLVLPSSVTDLGNLAFQTDKLESVVLNEGLENIGSNCFASAAIEKITLPQSLKSIGRCAFQSCKLLTSITIPSGVTSVGDNILRSCQKLETVRVSIGATGIDPNFLGVNLAYPDGSSVSDPSGYEFVKNSGVFYANHVIVQAVEEDGTVTEHDQSWNLELTGISELDVLGLRTLYFSDAGRTQPVALPVNVKAPMVLYVSHACLEPGQKFTDGLCEYTVLEAGDAPKVSLSSSTAVMLEIPAKVSVYEVTEIAPDALKGKGITELTLSSTIVTIGASAFEGCGSLASVTFAEGLRTIGSKAFSGCGSLNALNLPASLTDLASDAFIGCSGLSKISVAEGNTVFTAADNILYKDSGTVLVLCPASLDYGIDINDSVIAIGDWAFSGSKSSSVRFNDGLETIGIGAFSGSVLSSIEVPSSVVSIGAGALDKCTFLISITVHAGNAISADVCSSRFWNIDTELSDISGYSFIWNSNKDGYLATGAEITFVTSSSSDARFFEISKGKDAFPGFPVTGHTAVFCSDEQMKTPLPADFAVSVPMKVYVRQDPNMHTVTLVAEDAEPVEPVTVAYGSELTDADLPVPVRTGYDFAGWYLDQALEQALGTYTVPDSDFSLYAKWELRSHTLTYVAQDAQLDKQSDIVPYGAAVSGYLPVPVREGHSLVFWCTDAGLATEVPADMTMPDSDVTLYAKMAPNPYTVVFHTNGGSAIESIQVPYGQKAADSVPEPEKKGHTFAGWYLDQALEQPLGDALVPVGGLELYAKWDVNKYAVNYVTNGGSAVEPFMNDYGATVTVPAEDPVREGHAFAGWFMDSELSVPLTDQTMPDSAISVYAKWDLLSYTVNMATNGGSALSPVKVPYGAEIVLPEPEKKGYDFVRWCTDAQLQHPVDMTMPAEDITVYAEWTPASFKVSFDTAGGPAMADDSALFGSSYTLPEATDRTGYDFAGWIYDSELLKAGESLIIPAEDIVLTASWIKNIAPEDIEVPAEGGKVVIDVSEDTVKISPEVIDQAIAGAGTSEDAAVEMQFAGATVQMSPEALKRISQDSAGNVKTMSMSVFTADALPKDLVDRIAEESRELIAGSALAVSVSVTGHGVSSGLGKVTVTLPYTLRAGEDADGITVYFVADDGTLEKMDTVYDAEKGTVSFVTSHFSAFAVVYEAPVPEAGSSGVNLTYLAIMIAFEVIVAAAVILYSRRG